MKHVRLKLAQQLPEVILVKKIDCKLPREAFEVIADDGCLLISGVALGAPPSSNSVIEAIKKHLSVDS
jgi:hypothetical protein